MNSDNKIQTVWNKVKRVTSKEFNFELAPININNIKIKDSLTVVNVFNIYFLAIAENISSLDINDTDPLQYLKQLLRKLIALFRLLKFIWL
jgi:hypothetical protein